MANFVIGNTIETQQDTIDVTVDPQNPLPAGQHEFELIVLDDSGNASKPASFTVVVRDSIAPTAVLRGPKVVNQGENIPLDGSLSTDVAPGKVVRWRWTMRS